MIIVRCKECGTELRSGQTKSCGCSNMVRIKDDVVSAVDLNRVIMITSNTEDKKSEGLTSQDLQWQEQRRKRKVRKLDFEIR